MPAQFLIGIYVPSETLAEPLHQMLSQKSFVVSWSQSSGDFTDWVTTNRHRVDCLIIEDCEDALGALTTLRHRDILLPALTLRVADADNKLIEPLYHPAIIQVTTEHLENLDESVHRAVEKFLQLPAEQGDSRENTSSQATPIGIPGSGEDSDKHLFLLSLQQQRLTEKLRERLGYVGVYYKRNPQNFLRHMSAAERQEFLDKLRGDYRRIILIYFSNDPTINQKIDDFVNVAFFADMSVPKIVEIHMELIDDFSKQLRLEGRDEDILSDYRLTLIDVIAHLCEMYRRAIPRDL